MTMDALSLLSLLLLLRFQPAETKSSQHCTFPDSDSRQLLFDVRTDAPIGTLIAEATVDPKDAAMLLVSVLPEEKLGLDFTESFELIPSSTGRFALRLSSPLSLPSQVKVLKLLVTIVCNDELFPLFTIRARANDSDRPQFFNEPYQMVVNEKLDIGDTVSTPVVVVDWDTEDAPPSLYVQDADSSFEIITERDQNQFPQPPYLNIGTNETSSIPPPLVLLKLVKPIKRLPMTLKLVAENSNEKTAEAVIHIRAKLQPEGKRPRTHASKIQKGENHPLALQYDDNALEPGELTFAQEGNRFRGEEHPFRSLSRTKVLRKAPEGIRNDTTTRFEQCAISASMPENSEVGTIVTTLNVLNRKNWTIIDMVDPDGTFDIRQDTGEVYVRDNRIMDRELFTNLELVAEIHGSSHRTECSRVRVNVELLDENDNRPTFEKEKYVFILSDEFPVDSSIGIVRARDIDEGEAGHVFYHILNDSVPFELRPRGKDGEILAKRDLTEAEEYHLIVEARDNAPPFLSSQIPVDILVPKSKLKSSIEKKSKPSGKKINGVTSVTGEPAVPLPVPSVVEDTTLASTSTVGSTEKYTSNLGSISITSSTAVAVVEVPTTVEPLTAALDMGASGTPSTSIDDNSITYSAKSPTEPPNSVKDVAPASTTETFPGPPAFIEASPVLSTIGASSSSITGTSPKSAAFVEGGRATSTSRTSSMSSTGASRESGAFVDSSPVTSTSTTQGTRVVLTTTRPHRSTASNSTTSRKLTTTTRRTTLSTTRKYTTPVHPTLVDAQHVTKKTTWNTTNTLYSEEEYWSSESSEERTTSQAKIGESFDFVQPSYYYEVFGTPRDGDILGRVEARPHAQFYGIERKMNGVFRVDPDLGEIAVGPAVDRIGNGNHTFEVSATNGLRTIDATGAPCNRTLYKANTVVTVHLNSKRNRNDALPRFERDRYVFTVSENRPPSVVGVVRAYHVALSSNDVSIQYELLPSSSASATSLPFRVHPVSGEVFSEIALDRETTQNFEFKIRACLSVNPNSCGYTAVVVIVLDVNDNAPHFTVPEYQIAIPSDLPTGSDVITLVATDADAGINGDVNYAINPPSAVFGVDYHTGVVQTIAALTESHYELQVEAFDHGEPKRTAIAQLHIDVHGSNPSAPVFDKARYDVTLNSPIRAGAVVAQLHAKDPDPGLEGQITYRFEEPEEQMTESRNFSINEQTGVVSALIPFTSNDGPFDLLVIAEDQSTVFKRRASATLHIEIISNTTLRFLPLPSTIYISTEKAVGSVVLRASAFTSSTQPVRFHVLDNESQFVMDGDLLRVASHLIPGETHLTIRAESEGVHSDHNVRVVVMYDREKYPVFPQLTYDIDVPIDSQFPFVAHRFDARLQNGTLRYRFFPDGAAPRGLQINPDTGELTVTAMYARTASNHDTQFIVVRADNLDFPEFYSDVGVAINLVSSRKIRFPHSLYRLQITENAIVGTTLYPPIAVIPSNISVHYSIVPSTPLSILSNGTLVVNKLIDLEQLPEDQAETLFFTVTASVGEIHAVTRVQLKVKDQNEFSPRFDQKLYEVSLPEDSPPGSTIVKVRADDADRTDRSHLLYKIVGGSGRDFVFIQEDGTVVLGDTPLNHEAIRNFDVDIEAIDKGGNKDSTKVLVTVQDVNDNAPMFPFRTASWNVIEGSINATLDVTATDSDSGLNSELEYRIARGNSGGHFVIEKTPSNQIVLRVVKPMDYETQSSYVLTVETRDRGSPHRNASAVVIVNVINRNDNPPVFEKPVYEQEVSINLPIGFPIVTLKVNDADHDRLTFAVSGDPDCSSLTIDPLATVLFVRPISKRKDGSLICIITASDGVHTANATLRLNIFNSLQPTIETPVENHPPRFAKEVYTITLNSSQNIQLLAKVEATDPDGDVVVYSIEPPEFKNLFAIDARGRLSIRVPPSELTQSLYSFLVVAEDRGKPLLSTFTNIRVRVAENDASTPLSNSVDATPSTTSVTTSPGGTNPTASTIGGSTQLDEENSLETSKDQHSELPTVPTASNELPTSTTAHDKEVRFSRQKYTFALRNGAEVGTFLGRVDISNAEGVELLFKKSKQFTIDREGWIHTAAAISGSGIIEDKILARRKGRVVAETDFVVHIIASEPLNTTSTASSTQNSNTASYSTKTSFSTSSPTMLPQNDYTIPQYTRTTHDASPLSTTSKRESTTFRTTSPSTEALLSSTIPFTNAFDPQLTMTHPNPDHSSTRAFTIAEAWTTTASNTYDPPLTITHPHPDHSSTRAPTLAEAWTTTADSISETLDRTTIASAFSFTRSMYFAFVPEGQYTNGIRVTVKPEPFAVNRNTTVRYEIDGGADGGIGNLPFFLTADGQLIIFAVDREEQASYMFPIKATSDEYGVATATVNVTILDVNDNYPVFDRAPTEIGVFNDAPVGTPLFHFKAHDRDADNYGAITYGIEETDGPFNIDPQGGTLYVSESLATSLNTDFSVTAVARDNGRPSLRTTQKITVHIFDADFVAPMFPDVLPEKVIFVGTEPGTEVATVLAGPTINTRPYQEKILYGLVDNHNGLFEMEDDGRLILARLPRAEERNNYVQLNITAENSHGQTWVLMNIFIEGEETSTVENTVFTSQGPTSQPSCYFPTKVYNAEIMENREGRHRITKVTSSCESNGRPFVYSMSPLTDDFELDPATGEVFAVRPLDRERRSYHFLYITVYSGAEVRPKRIVHQALVTENAVAKLNASQTLVVVHVLDENDNAPIFEHVVTQGRLIATVDWQARLFSSILKLEAKDADEQAQLSYTLSGLDHDYFMVNATNGIVILAKTLANFHENLLQFTATVSDGLHITQVPVTVYVISPSSSLVQLTSELPHSQVDQHIVERTLNELTGLESHLLAKQPYVDHRGHADPKRSHLFVYALDRRTRAPYKREELAEVLEGHAASLLSSSQKISEVSLLSSPLPSISTADIVLAIVVAVFLLLLLILCCILSSYCKRKRAVATSDREYMVSSKAGPRPYDVEVISRATAQRVLSARPLPDPLKNQIEVAVSPIFIDPSANKSDTMEDFSNSVRERPSLLQTALARHKVHATSSKSPELPRL